MSKNSFGQTAGVCSVIPSALCRSLRCLPILVCPTLKIYHSNCDVRSSAMQAKKTAVLPEACFKWSVLPGTTRDIVTLWWDKNMHIIVNPLKPNSSNDDTLSCRPNLPFLISDIPALWHSAMSARVPECQKLNNGRLVLYGAEHSKCNHMMTLTV